jgi:hypothetical protein
VRGCKYSMLAPDLYFNLGDYGFPEWVSVAPERLEAIRAAGDMLLDRWTTETALELIDTMTASLQAHIFLNQEPDLEWVLSAMMIIYLRAQVRGEIPEYFIEE